MLISVSAMAVVDSIQSRALRLDRLTVLGFIVLEAALFLPASVMAWAIGGTSERTDADRAAETVLDARRRDAERRPSPVQEPASITVVVDPRSTMRSPPAAGSGPSLCD
ncbi:hypothetical protein HF998_02115 [Cellulomonas hominis]|uniref:Uncharacterized protein n=1 Tax=Cellulomonas hominis TaxID=156981 RepID=A0A7W8SES6_9CELL|nr:hypothetical protein [Cellulomonas hominis]MBB5472857.1 hypothetical protein [Cellulomonas hominis]NKY05782.1 hypothetical protein [Cellulomonas hominis]